MFSKIFLFFICSSYALANQPELIVTASVGGGLGNHMFLIAAAYAYALDVGGQAIFPYVELDHIKTCPVLAKVPRFSGPVPQLPVFWEGFFTYTPLPKNPPYSVCLSGFFQSAFYFNHRRQEILELFRASPELFEYLQTKYQDLLTQQTVAIHIRRGDYLTFRKEGQGTIMYNLSEDNAFYEKALQHFDLNSHHFVFFSDDMEFVKNMSVFKQLKHVTYVEHQYAHEDFYLMSFCKNHIIANSTFSWWAAYLCENPDQKVIFPWKWFGPGLARDLDPHGTDDFWRAAAYTPMDHWIKIE